MDFQWFSYVAIPHGTLHPACANPSNTKFGLLRRQGQSWSRGKAKQKLFDLRILMQKKICPHDVHSSSLFCFFRKIWLSDKVMLLSPRLQAPHLWRTSCIRVSDPGNLKQLTMPMFQGLLLLTTISSLLMMVNPHNQKCLSLDRRNLYHFEQLNYIYL